MKRLMYIHYQKDTPFISINFLSTHLLLIIIIMEIIYSAIALDNSIILVDHGIYKGNDPRKISLQILKNEVQANERAYVKYDEKITFILACTSDFPQDSAFAFIEEINSIFDNLVQPEEYEPASDNCLEEKFKDTLKGKIEHFNQKPKSGDNIGALTEQLIDYKNVVLEANDNLYLRGENINVIGDKAAKLQEESHRYHKSSQKVKKNEKNKRFWIITALVFVILLIIYGISVIVCGFNYKSCIDY